VLGQASSRVRSGLGFRRWRPGTGVAHVMLFPLFLRSPEVPEALFGLANVLFWLGDLVGTIARCRRVQDCRPA
jgi:hypothetical protein